MDDDSNSTIGPAFGPDERSPDEVLEQLRPRMRRARAGFLTRASMIVLVPVAAVGAVGAGWLDRDGGGAVVVESGPAEGGGAESPAVGADDAEDQTGDADRTESDEVVDVDVTDGSNPDDGVSDSSEPARGDSGADAADADDAAAGTDPTDDSGGSTDSGESGEADPGTESPEPTPSPGADTTTVTAQAPASGDACPAHDRSDWHPLVDPASGCHHDHHHGDDPAELDARFGAAGYRADWSASGSNVAPTSGRLDMAWPAPGDRADRRDATWLVRSDLGCSSTYTDGCVTDVRVLVNALFSGPGAVEQYRSARVEARLCRESDPGRCGTVTVGGWLDFGGLTVDGTRVPIGDQPGAVGGRRRVHSSNGYATWHGRNDRFSLALITPETWGPVDPADPSRLQQWCDDGTGVDPDCRRNGSQVGLHVLALTVQAELDDDGDGLVTWDGWVDRFGAEVSGCLRPGVDCVPISYRGVPVGSYQYRDDGHGFGDTGRTDHDTSPPGSSWIVHPD